LMMRLMFRLAMMEAVNWLVAVAVAAPVVVVEVHPGRKRFFFGHI